MRLVMGLCIGAIAMVGAAQALAQASVTVQIEPGDHYANEPFGASITIAGFTTCEPPVVPGVPMLSISQSNPPADYSRMIWNNGRSESYHSRTYSYEVMAAKEGTFVFPAVTVLVDGEKVVTKPQTLHVEASDAEELVWAEISCGRDRLFVGQRVVLMLTLYIKPIRAGAETYDANTMLRLISRAELGPFPRQQPTLETKKVTNPAGIKEMYYAYSFTSEYIAERPGKLTFDDVLFGMRYPTRGRLERNLLIRPRVAPVEVVPLPTAGRPPSFTGAVGKFGIAVAAKPTTVRVGDPIELTIMLSGDGAMATLPAPNLSASEALRQAFKVPDDIPTGEVVGSKRRFTAVIRATRADINEIPPIEYAYFDPDRERYEAARSDAIRLNVAPAEGVDAALVEGAAQPGNSNPAATDLRPLDGLRGNETREALLLRSPAAVTPARVAAAVSGPPAVFVLAWGIGALAQRGRGDPRKRRRAAAGRAARHRVVEARALPPRQRTAEIAAALAQYVADRAGEPVGRMLGRGSLEYAERRGVRPEALASWRSALEHCEHAAFAGDAAAGTAGDALEREALASIERMEGERL